MRILFLLGLVMNTFLINAQYQLPKQVVIHLHSQMVMGNFVEVDFDCKIDYNLSQIEFDRIVIIIFQLKMPCHH